MITSRDFRARARAALNGKWKKWILLFAVAAAMTEAFGLEIPLVNWFSTVRGYEVPELGPVLFNVPAGFGWVLAAVIIACRLAALITGAGRFRAAHAAINDEDISLRTLFPWELLGKCIVMNIVRFVLIWLWSLLLVFPGLIAAVKYSMADDLLARHPEMGPIEALRESRIRMNGFKMGLFALELSFLGWALLIVLGSELSYRLVGAIGNPALAVIADYLCTAALWFGSAALMAYMFTAEALFFEQVEKVRANPYFEGAQNANPYGQSANPYGQSAKPYGQYAQDPEPQSEPEPEPAADEAEAEKMYLRYGCSRNAMRRAGVLEEYEAMGAASYREEIWRRDYANALMRRFGADESALDDVLRLAAEYSMDGLTDRAMERIERHIREESVPPETVLNMAGRAAAMLTSGAFDGDPGFVARKKAQILSMTDRMELRLSASDPGGSWMKLAEMIRGMCA